MLKKIEYLKPEKSNKINWKNIPIYTWFTGTITIAEGCSGLFYKNVKEVCYFGTPEHIVEHCWYKADYEGGVVKNYHSVDVAITIEGFNSENEN